jgi:hypothetical protein
VEEGGWLGVVRLMKRARPRMYKVGRVVDVGDGVVDSKAGMVLKSGGQAKEELLVVVVKSSFCGWLGGR